ncbi:MAG: ribbon-helix-helix protein, CopG family [Lentisphaerae bacterium]|nr:ribbon-helix-helix protein, CopG family [Lentisphaerota bacterium]MBT4815569.1 ribbon-helix-helix protein, CopG family [Lentisphaerota bacterium]MBT5609022.1 ribbon-helix-helix protein, CopG family [Lentisphaerota bacterium]MBT7055454.1 ribbon-helix-helix protein, CopG family [Lentisphaerota bacterium]MBT7846033.1 ribbon-helix-helix protein, CopG family [Lentisphaerota bacterium]
MAAMTVNISFQAELLADIDAEAKREARSRSELLREAARLYVERQRRWDSVFRLGDEIARKAGLTEADVQTEVTLSRRDRR